MDNVEPLPTLCPQAPHTSTTATRQKPPHKWRDLGAKKAAYLIWLITYLTIQPFEREMAGKKKPHRTGIRGAVAIHLSTVSA